jgi:hypothetical protein
MMSVEAGIRVASAKVDDSEMIVWREAGGTNHSHLERERDSLTQLVDATIAQIEGRAH